MRIASIIKGMIEGVGAMRVKAFIIDSKSMTIRRIKIEDNIARIGDVEVKIDPNHLFLIEKPFLLTTKREFGVFINLPKRCSIAPPITSDSWKIKEELGERTLYVFLRAIGAFKRYEEREKQIMFFSMIIAVASLCVVAFMFWKYTSDYNSIINTINNIIETLKPSPPLGENTTITIP